MGNLLIMVTMAASRSLDSPMYFFFFASLSFIDDVYSTIIATKMIINLLHEKKTIFFQNCVTQVFIDHLTAGAEVILLMVMANDWYVAIYKPLHYLIILNRRVCVLMLLVAWAEGLLHSLIQLFFIYQLPFCGPNVTDNFVCCREPAREFAPMTRSCGRALMGKASQGSRGTPWICLSFYPKTRICLFYYFMTFTNSSDINGGLSPTTFLWRKLT